VLTRVLIYTAFLLLVPTLAPAATTTVLVFPLENVSTDRNLDWIGEGIAELIIDRLQIEPGIYMFSREERLAGFDKLGIPDTAIVSRATALRLGWDAGADNVITGRFSGSPDEFEISVRLIDIIQGGAADEIKVKGKLEDVILMTTSLSRQLLDKIVPGNASPETDYTLRPPTPRSAFENYIRGILNPDARKRVESLQNAIRLHPQYSRALFHLGRTFHVERDFKTSNQWLQKVPETSFDRPQSQFMMGLNYFYLADYVRAVAMFQQLPPTYDVLLNLGAALSQRGDQAGAIATWKRAAAVDPLASEAFFNIGYVSFLRGDWENAARNLAESLRVRGRDSEALFLLGRTYAQQGRSDDSQRLIAQASRLSQRVERWQTQPLPKLERLATTTVLRTRDETWTDWRIVRRAKAQDLTSWFDLVQNQIDSNFYGEAIRELQYLIRVFPDSSEARSLLDEVNRRRNVR
jgi:tetratricopeptide (TPR) repeat protein/TolB-like protein